MRNRLQIVFLATVIALCSVPALAARIDVEVPKQEGVTPMGIRAKALNVGFAEAIMLEAAPMFSPALSEERAELLKQYFVDYGKPYVQGYKILSTGDLEVSLSMALDVRVNRKTLRAGLERMGLFATSYHPLSAAITWPEDATEEEILTMQGLMLLSGIERVGEVFPLFTLERADKGKYTGRLILEDREFLAIDENMAKVWFDLWPHYFARVKKTETSAAGQYLVVSGWFSADGVLEFDRVLRGWDLALQEAQLVEMDMQATGVGATWDVHISDVARFQALLKGFLPQRGLTYQVRQVGTHEFDAPEGEIVE